MRDLAREAFATGQPLAPLYHRYFKIWCALGWPAFLGVIAIFVLMVFKPVLQLPAYITRSLMAPA
jgi:uncharacterized membrane protein